MVSKPRTNDIREIESNKVERDELEMEIEGKYETESDNDKSDERDFDRVAPTIFDAQVPWPVLTCTDTSSREVVFDCI